MPDPFTIRIFVPDGDPEGIRLIDRMNWAERRSLQQLQMEVASTTRRRSEPVYNASGFEPCPFLSGKLPVCSTIRPTKTQGPAMGAVKALTADGLFIGQSSAFLQMLHDLAADADAARRE